MKFLISNYINFINLYKINNHQRVLRVLQPKMNNFQMGRVLQPRKGQLKIQQMIFMLLGLTLFFILVALFFIMIKFSSLEKEVIELNRDKAAGLVEKLASSPEFIFENQPNSIDADKLIVLKSDRRYYDGDSTFWGVKGVIVRKIYPKEDEVECISTNYPDCNLIKLFTDKNSAPVGSFVSWCSKKSLDGNPYNECSLAEIMIVEDDINEK